MNGSRDRLKRRGYDALVIGSGPNGLSAAITLARAGRSVAVLEARDTPGGGARTAELTLPGFKHDICSAIHPMGLASPFFRTLPLERFGLEWIQPTFPAAHPLDDGSAGVLQRSLEDTCRDLGPDGPAYHRLFSPFVQQAEALIDDALAPLGIPRHPLLLARFGLRALRSAQGLVNAWFRTPQGRGLFAGMAAHSILPLDQLLTAAIGLMLSVAGHAVGWPLPRGGSQAITQALVGYLESLGGEVVTGWQVQSRQELPPHRALLLDVAPRHLAGICRADLPPAYRRRLLRYRHGPGVFKLDLALAGPIPWKAPACCQAGTVHLGGSFEEIAAAEKAVWSGQHPSRPYVLVAQQSRFDPSRAPAGRHTAWAYCHVPPGSILDQGAVIEQQIERFAPGFRDLILARHTLAPADFEELNPNYVGGDITCGVVDLWQTFTRPVARPVPYATPNPRIFLCSAATPPGPGVHGMCGHFAARAALRGILA